MTILKLILAILEAIPILNKWKQQLQDLYDKQQREKADVQLQKAIDNAKANGNTQDLQSILGSKLDE